MKSAGFFEQMKGRGVRVISPDKLKVVTPSAKAKERFIIVDAVGVATPEAPGHSAEVLLWYGQYLQKYTSQRAPLFTTSDEKQARHRAAFCVI